MTKVERNQRSLALEDWMRKNKLGCFRVALLLLMSFVVSQQWSYIDLDDTG